MIALRPMHANDVQAAVELQVLAFPPPFPPELLWQADHLLKHINLFPEGQWVATDQDRIIGTCSNTLISEEHWQAHSNWVDTVGGPYLEHFSDQGTTLYGLDITVHPDFRKRGLGRMFYDSRYKFVKESGRIRYGTGCRLPGFKTWFERTGGSVLEYAKAVSEHKEEDRVLTPLLRYSLNLIDVIPNYMEDEESCNNAALLEWNP